LHLFAELGYGRLLPGRAVELNGKSYPISHHYGHAPLHLVGCNVPLDRRSAGIAGAARRSPHSLVQEFLNATRDNLWGFVSNGLKLRILRDNVSLVRRLRLAQGVRHREAHHPGRPLQSASDAAHARGAKARGQAPG
jgi:hypothetical protein